MSKKTSAATQNAKIDQHIMRRQSDRLIEKRKRVSSEGLSAHGGSIKKAPRGIHSAFCPGTPQSDVDRETSAIISETLTANVQQSSPSSVNSDLIDLLCKIPKEVLNCSEFNQSVLDLWTSSSTAKIVDSLVEGDPVSKRLVAMCRQWNHPPFYVGAWPFDNNGDIIYTIEPLPEQQAWFPNDVSASDSDVSRANASQRLNHLKLEILEDPVLQLWDRCYTPVSWLNGAFMGAVASRMLYFGLLVRNNMRSEGDVLTYFGDDNIQILMQMLNSFKERSD